jgi:large subunit ribosomal protein L19e
MELAAQKRIAAKILKCGQSRIWIDPARLGDVANAITAADVRRLISQNVIRTLPKRGTSKGRIRKIKLQKAKGRRKGHGSRKGSFGSRYIRKREWIKRIRAQRMLLKELLANGKIDKLQYKQLYRKAGGGAFRSRAHLLSSIKEKPEDKNAETRTKT